MAIPSAIPLTIGTMVLALSGAPGSAAPAQARAAAPLACIGSGSEAAINAALTGTGAKAVLCAGATFNLQNPVVFTAPDQEISTEGLPTGSSRATLRVVNSQLAMAINGNGKAGITIRNVQVDGNRPALGRISGGSALLELGGAGSDQTVRNSVIREPRGWSALHIIEGSVTNNVPQCQRATIVGNTIGPAGTDTPSGTWADGISLACGHSLVQDNTIVDATDGGIVVFGAPGSTIENNTITATSRVLLGGINMVDYDPVNGNYTGTVVRNNTVDGKSAFVKTGIAQGWQVWGCGTGTVYGATVTGNRIQGQHVGYGYAVNGVRDWTVTGNVDVARHVGVPAAGCGGMPSDPDRFQVQSATSSNLQSEFTNAQLHYVLAITEPDILKVARPPTTCGLMTADQGLAPGQNLASCDGRFTLNLQGDGNLVLRPSGSGGAGEASGAAAPRWQGGGGGNAGVAFPTTTTPPAWMRGVASEAAPLPDGLSQGTVARWASNTGGRRSAVALMQGDGNFVIYDSRGAPLWSSGTAGSAGARLALQNDGNLVVYSSSGTPIWATNTNG